MTSLVDRKNCRFCGNSIKDNRRGWSQHFSRSPSCVEQQMELERQMELDRRTAQQEVSSQEEPVFHAPAPPSPPPAFPDAEFELSDLSHDLSNLAMQEKDEESQDGGHDAFSEQPSRNSSASSGSSSEESSSEESEMEEESKNDCESQEDHASEQGECSRASNLSSVSSAEASGEDEVRSGSGEGPDPSIDSTIDPAQSQLDSFLGQPSVHEPTPEDLDLSYRILDLLQNSGAPLSCFEKIVDLTRRAQKMQAPLQPLSREKALSDLKKRFNQTELTPNQTVLELPSGLSVKITTIDFCAALGSLLSDPELMRDEHLLFFNDADGSPSPMGKPSEIPPEELTDILDGSVCRQAYQIYVKNKGDLLVPIILFIDKTHVDTKGRLTLEPLCMTLGIFKKEYRRHPEFWRTLGFVNTSRKEDLTPTEKIRDYHFVLSHILKSYKDAQKMDLQWTLEYKDQSHNVILKIPLLYVVGDTEGHDKLCAHYQNRTFSQCLCRYCECPREETGNPNASYKKTLASTIANLVKRKKLEELKERSYHFIINAFTGCDFCDPRRGINGATPGELLHVLEHGLYQYKTTAIVTAKQEEPEMKPRKRGPGVSENEEVDSNCAEDGEELDSNCADDVDSGASDAVAAEQHAPAAAMDNYLSQFQQAHNKSGRNVFPKSLVKKTDAAAKAYGQMLVHQSDREYHRSYFKDGICSGSSRQGHEERMVLFLFLMIFSSSMFPTYKKAFGSEERLSLYVLVLSHLLMIQDYMTKDSMKRTEIELLQKYMPHFMEMYKRATDRTDGMGMKIIKFHLLLHLPEDMLRFGPSTGYDSSFCESMHKVYKKDARRTQKRTDDSFQYQTAKRSCERIAIACGMRSIRYTDARLRQQAPTLPSVMVRGRFFTFPNGDGPKLPPNERKFLQNLELNRELKVFSTADIYGTLYRSEWWIARYDWAYVNWDNWGSVVARLKCYFKLEQSEKCYCPNTKTTFQGPGQFALAEAFTQNYNEAPDDDMSIDNFQAHSASSLLYRMNVSMEKNDVPQLFVVDLSSMVRAPAAVVPYDIAEKHPVEWLVVSPKWERYGIFQDAMEDLVRQGRKRK